MPLDRRFSPQEPSEPPSLVAFSRQVGLSSGSGATVHRALAEQLLAAEDFLSFKAMCRGCQPAVTQSFLEFFGCLG